MGEPVPHAQQEGHAVDRAATRARLEQLRRDRQSQLAEVSEVPVGEDDLAAPREAELRRVLAEVEAALERLGDGSYGRCEGCGQAIPPQRLEIMPHARNCVGCQQPRG